MDGLRAWTVIACTAAVLCTLLYRFFPDNSLGRQGRLLLPCLFLLALFLPLTKLDFSFSGNTATPSAVDAAALKARYEQQTVAYTNETLLAMANQALSSYGVQAKKVTADMNFAADGRIDIGQITVYVDEQAQDMAAIVRQVVEHRLGTSVVLAKWEETSG